MAFPHPRMSYYSVEHAPHWCATERHAPLTHHSRTQCPPSPPCCEWLHSSHTQLRVRHRCAAVKCALLEHSGRRHIEHHCVEPETKWTLADVERGQNSERVDPAEEPGEGDQSGGAGSEDCGCKKEPSEPSGRIGKRRRTRSSQGSPPASSRARSRRPPASAPPWLSGIRICKSKFQKYICGKYHI